MKNTPNLFHLVSRGLAHHVTVVNKCSRVVLNLCGGCQKTYTCEVNPISVGQRHCLVCIAVRNCTGGNAVQQVDANAGCLWNLRTAIADRNPMNLLTSFKQKDAIAIGRLQSCGASMIKHG